MALDPARDRSVRSEMERIFGPPGRPNGGRTVADAGWDSLPVPTGRRSGGGLPRFLTFAAPVTLLLASGLLVVATLSPTGLAVPSADVTRPAPKRVVASVVSAVASPAAPDAQHGRIAEPAARQAVAGAPSVPPPRPSASVVSSPRATASPTREAPRRQARPTRRIASDRRDPCAAGYGDACIYHDVVVADRRLRNAYARAVDDGAPRNQLADIQRRWRRARDVSLDEPDETIRRYNRLTSELRDLGSR